MLPDNLDPPKNEAAVMTSAISQSKCDPNINIFPLPLNDSLFEGYA